MKPIILAIWFNYIIVQGEIDPNALPEQIVALENSPDLNKHILKYPDGREHIKIEDFNDAMDKLHNKHLPMSHPHGKPGKWIYYMDKWIKKDDDPFLRPISMRKSSDFIIPRVPFIPWLNDLSDVENRLREATTLLRTMKDAHDYLEIPQNVVELKDYFIQVIENGGKIEPKIAVLVDNVLSESNKGDHFKGPLGDIKVIEDKHHVVSGKMKIIKAIGEQAFKLEKTPRGQAVDYGDIGRKAHTWGVKNVQLGKTGLT